MIEQYMYRPIYLDCHSTTPVDPRVVEVMIPFLPPILEIQPVPIISTVGRRKLPSPKLEKLSLRQLGQQLMKLFLPAELLKRII
jgi:hypothetical protein